MRQSDGLWEIGILEAHAWEWLDELTALSIVDGVVINEDKRSR
jgi:hypothetical protein